MCGFSTTVKEDAEDQCLGIQFSKLWICFIVRLYTVQIEVAHDIMSKSWFSGCCFIHYRLSMDVNMRLESIGCPKTLLC